MGLSPRLVRALGWCWLIVGLSALPFVLIATAEEADTIARGFAASAVLGLFAGGLSLAATRSLKGRAGPRTALRLALYGWLTTPLFAAPPLVAAAAGTMPGLFEAYSAMTTTGASVLDPDQQERSILLWRAFLQWIGGFATLILAVTVFAALELPGLGLRRSTLLTVAEEDLFTNFGRAARRLGLVYGLITVFTVLTLSLTALDAFEALCLALSGVSTGGMTPRSGPIEAWLPLPGQMILAACTLFGAWNLALQYELIHRGRAVRLTGDLRAMVAVCLAMAFVVALVFGPGEAWPAFLDTLFAITTAGFTTGEGVLPTVILLSLAVIGGSALSTSGGAKISRIMLLLKRAAGELSLLAHPSAAIFTRFAGRHVGDKALLEVWIVALSFPFAIGVAGILLGLAGLDFASAWQVAAASIANAGPLAEIDYAGLPPGAMVISVLAMIAGRLEILAAAAAVFVIIVRE
ncbi:TrkH family potassium uptake protein [Marinicauda algicola]|uniref:TrkH family potassium uptake protein n=1 Tax=Marinicauda algicola TaxID=2029849 RepID=A0A4S2GXV6_9PROT|nr:potassium transporter TrkG [Marinicauda algicola]TGY87916.1 TrkH family potassium uptake protein [Marinicauda algicola]